MTGVSYRNWWLDHRLVFVGGLHRSGKTYLTTALSRSRSASLLDGTPGTEGQHLQDQIPSARAFGGPGRFAFHPGAHLTERSTLANPAVRRRIMEQWRPHWDTERWVLVEESPPNLVRLRFLQHLFPDARMVVVIRHPQPVSLETRVWARGSLDLLMRHWLHAHELLATDANLLSNLLLVRFETLLHRPQVGRQAVADFLGLDDLAWEASRQPVSRIRQMIEYRRLSTALPKGLIDRYSEAVARFGYDLANPLASPTPDVRIGTTVV